MSRPPTVLPADLGTGPFSLTVARSLGATRHRLLGADLLRPTPGVRSREPATEVCAHARAFAVGLPPDIAFSHDTAARILGLPMPTRWSPTEPLHVMRRSERPLVERAGCHGHRGLEGRSTTTESGLRVVSALDTWCDVGVRLDLTDLVVVADALLGPPFGLGPAALARAAAGRVRCRGVAHLREAATLCRVGSGSPQETRCRLVFADGGLPEPELNLDIFDSEGNWLGRVDFGWRERKIVAEYDGDQHRTDRTRWQYERERRLGLEDAGWTYVELTALSLSSGYHRARLIDRLARLLL